MSVLGVIFALVLGGLCVRPAWHVPRKIWQKHGPDELSQFTSGLGEGILFIFLVVLGIAMIGVPAAAGYLGGTLIS